MHATDGWVGILVKFKTEEDTFGFGVNLELAISYGEASGFHFQVIVPQ